MRQFNTLTGFLGSKASNPTTSDTVEFQGFTAIGDGYAAKFQHNGVTGQTPSQSPIDLGLAVPTLNDLDGNQWVLIDGAVQEFDAVLFYPSPFGDSGKGMYAYLESVWVKLSDTTFIPPMTTTELINSSASFLSDIVIPSTGFTDSGDGGNGPWIQNGVTGQTASQSPAQLGDALLNDASGNQWAFVGSSLFVKQIGGVLDGIVDNTLITDAIISWSQSSNGNVFIGDGVYLTGTSSLTSKRLNISGLGESVSEWKLKNGENTNCFSLTGTGRLIAKNISINQNKANQTGGHGIRLGGCDQLLLEDITIYNTNSYGIGSQAGTNKNMKCTNLTIHTTGLDGIDLKDVDLANETFFLTNYTAYNYGLNDTSQVALDVRGPVEVNNINATLQNNANYGVRYRPGSVQGRAGFGSMKGINIAGTGLDAGSIGLDISSDSANWVLSDVTCDSVGIILRLSTDVVGGLINGLTGKNIHGSDCISLLGSDTIISNLSVSNLAASTRIIDFEAGADNIQINNFLLTDNSGSAEGIRIQTGCVNIALSNGVLKNSILGDGGTATILSNFRLL